jgi:hypothetical protein
MSFYDFDDKAGLLDRMLAGPAHRLGRQAPEHHPSMPRFQGRELPLDQQLDAVRRRDARMHAGIEPTGPARHERGRHDQLFRQGRRSKSSEPLKPITAQLAIQRIFLVAEINQRFEVPGFFSYGEIAFKRALE